MKSWMFSDGMFLTRNNQCSSSCYSSFLREIKWQKDLWTHFHWFINSAIILSSGPLCVGFTVCSHTTYQQWQRPNWITAIQYPIKIMAVTIVKAWGGLPRILWYLWSENVTECFQRWKLKHTYIHTGFTICDHALSVKLRHQWQNTHLLTKCYF